ncbi:MAG TPA: class 1 isoprenoid biosynthesis enzyme [Prolixibacteraceae bacterium]|nr:class 1 isoprenoid biosynthesis enzyme [Prolixibacteraceae bacterium]
MEINAYIDSCAKIWNELKTDFPFEEGKFTDQEKKLNQNKMQSFSNMQRNMAALKTMDAPARKKLSDQLNANFAALLKNVFKFNRNELSVLSSMQIMDVSKKFFKMARDFDPSIAVQDIFQASRNLWIVNSLQVLMGLKPDVSESVFAYSMLYPYSDNYLDDKTVSKSEKISFSKRFRQRLLGFKTEYINKNEKAIFDLVGMIENEWDRERYPKVYESLLAIHDAQTRSILLMDAQGLSETDLLSICIEKGGTSVLADGYLIKGDLTPDQEHFCFGFGTFLQFVDDLQDVREDMEGSLTTFFTRSALKGSLEIDFNRTIHFTNRVLDELSCFSANNTESMKQMMFKSTSYLLVEAVALNHDKYIGAYLNKMEAYSPFGFEFIRLRRSKMESNRISFMRNIESMFKKEFEPSLMAV